MTCSKTQSLAGRGQVLCRLVSAFIYVGTQYGSWKKIEDWFRKSFFKLYICQNAENFETQDCRLSSQLIGQERNATLGAQVRALLASVQPHLSARQTKVGQKPLEPSLAGSDGVITIISSKRQAPEITAQQGWWKTKTNHKAQHGTHISLLSKLLDIERLVSFLVRSRLDPTAIRIW